jgi:hypothetical protein
MEPSRYPTVLQPGQYWEKVGHYSIVEGTVQDEGADEMGFLHDRRSVTSESHPRSSLSYADFCFIQR